MRTIEGYTECSHGYRGPHCTMEAEGSCPYSAHDNAPCRCNESEWMVVPADPEINRVYQSEAHGALRIINRNGDVIDTVTDIHRKVYFGDRIGGSDDVCSTCGQLHYGTGHVGAEVGGSDEGN